MIKISKLFAAMVLAGVASHSFAADTIKIGIAGEDRSGDAIR